MIFYRLQSQLRFPKFQDIVNSFQDQSVNKLEVSRVDKCKEKVPDEKWIVVKGWEISWMENLGWTLNAWNEDWWINGEKLGIASSN